MKSAIKARIMIEDEEIEASYEKPQIILSGQTAGFRITFCSRTESDFSKIIKYIINEKHIFKFMIKAQVVPVDLELSESRIELNFAEDNIEMFTTKSIVLKNNGNDKAQFDWYSPSNNFRVEPKLGFVDPGRSTRCTVYFTPAANIGTEEQILDVRITNGKNKSMSVVGNVILTNCELSTNSVDFGSIAVGELAKTSVFIKNTCTKFPAVFRIEEKTLTKYLKISPLTGRISSDVPFKLDLEFKSMEQQNKMTKSFNIFIRGSKTLTVQYTADVIIPKVIITEPEFNFGTIIYGNNISLPITLENTSPITAKLFLDLRPDEDDPETDGYK